jgi:hypothetical protein
VELQERDFHPRLQDGQLLAAPEAYAAALMWPPRGNQFSPDRDDLRFEQFRHAA